MNKFPFDKLQATFIREFKRVFTQFISLNKERTPYIFTLSVPDYIAINHPHSYCISTNGNTIQEFEEKGYSFNTEDAYELYYKYSMDEWNEHSGDNDFPESNQIILDYIIDNEDAISDEEACFTEEFMNFRNEFFEFLIRNLEELRNKGFLNSVYSDKILLNFEVREYYDEDEMCQIFERLNTKEDVQEFKEWL